MVAIASIAADGPETRAVLNELDRQARDAGADPDFIYVFYGCDHDDETIRSFLNERFPGAAFLGGTSCSGVMNESQIWGPRSIGMLLVGDQEGDYGVASAPLGDDAGATAETTIRTALANAGCPSELPELVWVFQAPGREEDVIDGFRRVVGDRCPIIGGSAADNTVSGAWRQIGPEGVFTDGLIVGVLFPSGGVGFSYQGGYEPAGPSGVITRIAFDRIGDSGIVTRSRGRQILEIDGAPAARIYNSWIGELVTDKIETGGNILADTTMWPLAVDAGQVDGLPHYLLIHPDAITPKGGLSTFAAIAEGTRVYSMRGEKERLIERAGRVATEAAIRLPGGAESLAGGLLVYCAGCMLAVGEQMPRVAESVRASFNGMPFLGCFTFGEQGSLVDRNVHGNLMISAIAFGR